LSEIVDTDWHAVIRKFAKAHHGVSVEHVCTIYLIKDRVIHFELSDGGAGDSVELPFRKIVQTALDNGCTSIVISHNHPSGHTKPSRADIRQTRILEQAIRPLGIALEDHVIVAGNAIFSFRQEGLY
jgi:DNA repair protein RadC